MPPPFCEGGKFLSKPENFRVSSESLKYQQIIINIRINQQQVSPYVALAEAFPVIMKGMIPVRQRQRLIFCQRNSNYLQFSERLHNILVLALAFTL